MIESAEMESGMVVIKADEMDKLLAHDTKLSVLIVGHTDNAGTLEYNHKLSEQRAQAVVNALVTKHGIRAERLTAAGVGMASPLASNDGEQGRSKNRRVEVVKR